MLEFQIQQSQWLLMAMAAGLALTVLTVLVYFALWRKRGEVTTEAEETRGNTARWIVMFLPWVLILSFVGVTIYAIVYTLRMIMNPPNW